MVTAIRGCYVSLARLAQGRRLGRVPGVRMLNRWLRAWLIESKGQPRRTYINGHSMYLDPWDSLSLSVFGQYDPETTALAERLIRPGDVAVDVGANIGYFTLLAARATGPHGQVYAFEPDPANFALLKANVEMNGYHNVVPAQVAVSDAPGRVDLYVSRGNAAGHSLARSEPGQLRRRVEAVRLDDTLAGVDAVQFIKMDVEGAEGHVLRGMRRLLGRSPVVNMVCEFAPTCLERCGTDPLDLLLDLEDAGFSLREIDGRYVAANRDTVDRVRQNGVGHTNFWCAKGA